MLRILHTSDWHLGHRLHDVDRGPEHDAFLAWLLDRLEEERIDALLVAGDIFDAANPPAEAVRRWFGFLAAARRRFPALDIVVIGGNHDSAARLDAPNPLCGPLGIHVVGGLPAGKEDAFVDRILAPLRDAEGEVAAWAIAVPFLRPADLPRVEGDGDPLIEGVRAVYRRAVEAARARAEASQAIVALGHCYMVGGAVSELSERRILGGNQHALPLDVFDEDLAYVALGHLHKAQAVGREGVRYCGSPLPLSLSERGYAHEVRVVVLEGPALVESRAVLVPRAVGMLRIPEVGAAGLTEVLEGVRALPSDGEGDDAAPPFLEVCVRLEAPRPELRAELEAALADRRARLVRIGIQLTGGGEALGDARPGAGLDDLSPEEVFRLRWARDYEGDPPPALLAAFHEILDDLGQQGAA